MPWENLREEVAEEFLDAQDYVARRVRARLWAAHSMYVLEAAERKRRFTLRAIRTRIHAIGVVACVNPKCRVEFAPYRVDTRYCTAACRIRHLALQAHYRRKLKQSDKRTRICPECTTHFTDRRIDAVYCSRECTVAVVRREAPSRRKSRAKAPVQCVCPQCGGGFERRNAKRRFCSDACSWKAWVAANRRPKIAA